MTKLEFEHIPQRLLLTIYEEARDSDTDGSFLDEDFYRLSKEYASPGFTSQAINTLLSQKFIRQTHYEPLRFELTIDGITFVESQLKNETSMLSRIKSDNPPEQPEFPSFREFRESLLIALGKKDSEQLGHAFDLKEIADDARLRHRKGWVQKAGEYFDSNGFIRAEYLLGEPDEGVVCQLTGLGLDEAEKLMKNAGNKSGPQSRPQPKFTEFRDALTIALYEKSNDEGLNLYLLKDLADEKNIAYHEGWILEFSNFLDVHGYALVRKVMGGDPVAAAQLNASGLEYAEELIAEAELEEIAPDVEPLLEIAGSSDTVPDGDGVPIIAVPASNRIVSRTDNQGAWNEATKTLDAVIAEYKKDHPRDNEVGSEKTALLGALIAGRKLFDDTRINVEVGVTLLIEPLKLIVRRYEKELIGGLAATAFAAIAKLFGIL